MRANQLPPSPLSTPLPWLPPPFGSVTPQRKSIHQIDSVRGFMGRHAIEKVLYQVALGHEEDKSEAKQFVNNHGEPLGKWRASIFVIFLMLAGSIACFFSR